MELASIIGYAMIKMMFLLAVGFAAAKGGVLDEERSRAVNALLMNVLVPALIISGFTSGYDESKMRNLMLSLLLSCLGMGLSVLITNILIRRKGSLQLGSERGNAAFPNVGFLGIPLVQALYGFVHVRHQERIVQIFQAGTEETAGLLKGVDAALDQ